MMMLLMHGNDDDYDDDYSGRSAWVWLMTITTMK